MRVTRRRKSCPPRRPTTVVGTACVVVVAWVPSAGVRVNVPWHGRRTQTTPPSPPFFLKFFFSPTHENAMRAREEEPPPTCKRGTPTKTHICADEAGRRGEGTSLLLFCFLTHSAHASDDDDVLTDGARAVKAFSRPYPVASVETPIDIQFNISKAEFRMVVRVRAEDAPVFARLPSTSRTRPGYTFIVDLHRRYETGLTTNRDIPTYRALRRGPDGRPAPVQVKTKGRSIVGRCGLLRRGAHHALKIQRDVARMSHGTVPASLAPQWPRGGRVRLGRQVGARGHDAQVVVPRPTTRRDGSRIHDRRRASWRSDRDEGGPCASGFLGTVMSEREPERLLSCDVRTQQCFYYYCHLLVFFVVTVSYESFFSVYIISTPLSYIS